MTHIGAKGRSDHLVKLIVKAIQTARREDNLPEREVELIFGDLLKDHVIQGKLEE